MPQPAPTQPALSLTIQLENVSKKFGSNRVFSNVNLKFEQGKKYAIIGPNGSGKSTLLKVIAGIVTPNSGTVNALRGEEVIDLRELYHDISFCAPYMELPEELTLPELLKFHQTLRQLQISLKQFTSEVELEENKEIRNYSSGMKQRLKLALAFYTTGTILLLDEPTATLDEHWNDWYLKLIQNASAGKLIIISSNHPAEYAFCDSVLSVLDYKK